MAGVENKIVFGNGFKLQPSQAADLANMQELSTDIADINHTGSPAGVVSANPGSFSRDPVSGIVYVKGASTDTSLWAAISTSTGTVTSVSGTANQVGVATGTSTPVISLIGPYTPATYAAHGVLIGEGTSSIVATAVGTTGQVLTGVTGADPVWASPATAGTVTSVSGTANQVSVATGTSTPVISLIGPYTPATYTAHGVLFGEGTSSIVALAAGTAGQHLQSGGAGVDPSWTTTTYPSTNAVSTLLYASSANVMAALATANNGVLITGTTGVPSILAAGTTGKVLTATTGSAPSWVSPATAGTVTSVSGTANQVSVATGTSTPVISLIGPYTPATYTTHGLLVGEGTSSIVALGAGTAGQVLVSGGASADPAYSANLVVQTSGSITAALNPCAFAYLHAATTSVTGDGTVVNPVVFDTLDFDQQSNFNLTTGLFTAPNAGKYLVSVSLTLINVGASFTSGELNIRNNGSAIVTRKEFNPGIDEIGTDYVVSDTAIMNCNANDTISASVQVSGSTKTVGIKSDNFGPYSYISIVKVA